MLCRLRVVEQVNEGDELAFEAPARLAAKQYDDALRSLEAAKTCYETAAAEDDYHARLVSSAAAAAAAGDGDGDGGGGDGSNRPVGLHMRADGPLSALLRGEEDDGPQTAQQLLLDAAA